MGTISIFTCTIFRQLSEFGGFQSQFQNWAIRLVENKDSPFKFHFVKNGMKVTMRKMPIHGMVSWAPSLNEMILFFEDLCKKKKVGLVCPMNKIDDSFTPTSANKRFIVKDILDFNAMAILEKWYEFKEGDYKIIPQKIRTHCSMVESLSGKPPIKMLWKEATNVEKKEKIMGKIVMGKKTKGFDLVECHVKDATIRKEYANMFPLGFAPVKDVRLLVDRFKRSPPKIVYYPLFREHVNKIKTQITIYNKYDTKVPIFVIPEDPERPKFHSSTSSQKVGGHSQFTIFDYRQGTHDYGYKG
jgi:hypothetical protein